MKQTWRRYVALTSAVTVILVANSRGTVVAMAPEAMYESPADVEMMTLSVKANAAEVSEASADVVDTVGESYRNWKLLQREHAIQERLQNLERTQREMEAERQEQERLRKIEEERLKKEKKQRKIEETKKARRKKIKKACGKVRGTKAQTILERIVEAEAGGEDQKGRILVANVVLNRVMNKEFPNTVSGVVFAHSGNRYQFSPVSNGSYYRVHVSKGTKKAVQAALDGEDPSQGALYFMERALADSGNVKWFDSCLTRIGRHGCHEFYK